MTRVVFLHDVNDRLRAAASWLNLPRARNVGVAVFVPNQQHAERLDRLLWEQSPTSFTPHCAQESALSSQTPIIICSVAQALWPHETVLNLSDEIPPHLEHISELVEIVSLDSATVAAGRTRYTSYKKNGLSIEARNAAQELSS
ncbi:MAG: DNA polymerase III subunit chi [Rhodocyclaceae bacterium]|nr:DNA polymerase III subunit chi [Rhodocyclaceae bacterium]MBL0075422.1 DNA polymerase III subunit chi [Rhodocyclaceae bacterium]MBP6108550.1 DNA polymerase III subunit chi [Rhodocyclaceae bacterium]MBP6278655.1 DNA polymerase III subunit chi [Rhodocyclaceae bacterium]